MRACVKGDNVVRRNSTITCMREGCFCSCVQMNPSGRKNECGEFESGKMGHL